MPYLDPDKTILGTYGEVYINGELFANFNHLEATDDENLISFNVVGKRRTQHKSGPVEGTGTISGLKVTSKILQMPVGTRFEIISKLADPEAYGYERIRFRSCKFKNRQWANWTAGEQVQEEVQFVYDEDPELLDPIVEV
jgi:hypothetical protein